MSQQIENARPCRAEFTCEAPHASSVLLIGSFNDWDIRTTPMTRNKDGDWTTVLDLPPGHYEYKYIVVYHGQVNVRDEDHYGTVNHTLADFREPQKLEA